MQSTGQQIKRQGEHENGGETRRVRHDAKVSVTIVVPSDATSFLIGKQGVQIKQLEQESGSTISFAKQDESIMGEALRVVTIWSDSIEKNIAACRSILTVLFAEDGPRAAMKKTLRMLVQTHLVAGLIGKAGAGIKAVIDQSHAFISFAREQEMPPGSTARLVTISGQIDEIIDAAFIISTKHHELEGLEDAWKPHQPKPNAFQKNKQYNDYGAKQHFNDFSGKQHFDFVANPEDPYVAYQDPRGQAFGYGAQNAAMMGHAAMGAAHGNDSRISVMLQIPNEIVGLFIGQKGANIKMISRLPGIYISVLKEDEVVGDASGLTGLLRPVKIEGPLSSVMQAQEYAFRILMDLCSELNITTVCSGIVNPPKVPTATATTTTTTITSTPAATN